MSDHKIPLSASLGPPRFELIRAIFIDSYTEGRITEVPLAGGLAITGRNGRGKTSLLRLIPAFYGERPDRIVKPVSNQKNFARYYLPRSTSYIVYEYQREDAICCAVLCADPSGDGVDYRFVNSPFQREWFVHDDEATLVASSNLLERLKLRGISCTRKMPLDQYRAVLQGKRVHGSDLKQHRRDVQEYAFCPANRPLLHIERIVFGMFMRKTNFNDLQRMIVSTVTDAKGSISLGTERKKVENWPDAYLSYTNVMAEAHRMDDIQNSYNTVLAAEQELRNIHGRFHSLDCTLENDQLNKKHDHDKAMELLEEAEQKYSAVRKEVIEKIDHAVRTIDATAKKLEQLRNQKTAFDDQKVQEKADLIDREDEINQTKNRLQARKTLLLSTQQNIEDEYRKLFDTLRIEHSERAPEFERQRTNARQAHQARIDVLSFECEQQESEVREVSAVSTKCLQDAVDLALEALGRAKGQLEAPQPDPSLVEAAERQQTKVEQARVKLQEVFAQEGAARKTYEGVKDAFIRCESQIRTLQVQINEADVKLNSLLRYATPDEDSVLYVLRSENPTWTNDIAKVLREDLLTRTDLSPIMGEVCDSIYGLRVNLDLLESPLAANESALQAEIDAARNTLQNLRDRLAQQDAILVQCGTDRNAAEAGLTRKSADVSIAKSALSSAEQQLNVARADMQRSRSAAEKKAQLAHQDAIRACENSKQSLSAFLAKIEQEILVLKLKRDQRKTDSERMLHALLAEIRIKETEATTRYENAKTQISNDRKARLEASGVDTEALSMLEKEINAAEECLTAIHASRNLVLDWRRWLSVEWSQKSRHEDVLTTAQKDKDTHEEARTACTKAWHEESNSRKQAINIIKQQLAEIATKRDQITRHRKVLEPYPVDMAAVPEFDTSWQVAVLVGQTGEQLNALKVNEGRLHQDIGAIKRAFTASRNSPSDQYFDTQRQALGPDRADRSREWVPAFKSWYSTEHMHYQNLLRVDARTIAEAVADFRERMNTFHLKVQQFNRELQESLNTNQGFESIGSLSVEIVSSIRELEYWNTVERVVEARRDWMTGDATTLPPPEFAIALRELLSHWQLKDGIQAELTGLVRIQGEVVENGNRRPFRKAEDLETISSNGLSYIVMVLIFVGFINRVRGKAPVNVVWALDEIKDLDIGNVELLMDILTKNNITLVSACPDPDPDVLALFRNRRSIRGDRYIYDPSTVAKKDLGEVSAEIVEDANV